MVEESLNSKKTPNSALWELGFRPFFLGAALFSMLSIGLWLVFFFGALPYRGSMAPITWHSHEMVYGFTSAVIAGFVLTASQNWTGKPGAHGFRLQALFSLWALARILLLASPRFMALAAVFDLGFYPLLAVFLAPYLKGPDMKIERVFFLYFLLFFSGNLLVHLEVLGVVSGYSRKGVLLGLYTVVLVIIFMGGRVIPFFTESSIAKAQPRVWKSVEILSHVTAWGFLITQIFWEGSPWAVTTAFCAASVHLVRVYGWYVRRVRRVALLWILHLGYFWIVTGFVLSGFASLGWVTPSLAIHAFTAGALGAVIYGMISRVSLGHTGRALRPAGTVVAGFYFLTASAVIRVFGPMLNPTLHDAAVFGSGLLWIGAFGIFVVIYWPILIKNRIST